jgi:hypothetical protein
VQGSDIRNDLKYAPYSEANGGVISNLHWYKGAIKYENNKEVVK